MLNNTGQIKMKKVFARNSRLWNKKKKGGMISKLKGGGTGIWAGKSPGVDTATTIDGVTY